MTTKVIMPQLGESVVEGTVVQWLVKEGETVEEFQSLLEVESAKVNTEIPSPADGVLLKIVIPEGTTVKAGTVIAWIGESGEKIPEGENEIQTVQMQDETEMQSTQVDNQPAASVPKVGRDRDLGFISPVVARLAREHHLDLTLINGSGQGGRITKKDVLTYLENPKAEPDEDEIPAWETPGEGDLFRPTELQFPNRKKVNQQPVERSKPQIPREVQPQGDGKLIPHTAMRRSIAAHMVHSKSTAPHVTTVMEADLFEVVKHRESHKQAFADQGVKLTFTAYFIQAVIAGLKKVPVVNASWREDGIFIYSAINIGMAAALDEGLIVPVIKNAENYSLIGLARMVNDLANRAKSKQLKPEEVVGGTFTVTNHGTGGSLFATPIINQPQCAILGVGTIKKRPVVINDAIAIRPMVYLSLTFDHRILDGALADGFLAEVVNRLENWL